MESSSVSDSLLGELAQSLKASSATTDVGTDPLDCMNALNQSFVSCLKQVLQGGLRVADFIRVVKESSPAEATTSINNALVGSLWILASQHKQLSAADSAAAATAAGGSSSLTAILKDLIISDLIDANVLKASMELSSLIEGGIVKEDEQVIQKRIIKINTGLVYKQQKYNLLREETEGYSKLVLVLNNVSRNDSNHVKSITENVLGIIGQFDLDPNRVFDIILDAFERQPLNQAFIEILRSLRPTNLVHTLGFKFLQYHEASLQPPAEKVAPPEPTISQKSSSAASKSNMEVKATNEESTQPKPETKQTPHALFQIAAMLIVSELISVEELAPYLHPSIQDTQSFVLKYQNTTEKTLSAIKFDSKTAKGILSMRGVLESNKESSLLEELNRNQLLGLLIALITLRGWNDAKALASIIDISLESVVNSIQPIRKEVLALFAWQLDHLYSQVSFQASLHNLAKCPAKFLTLVPNLSHDHQLQQFSCLETLLEDCWEMIELVKHHIGEDPKLLAKLCRLLKALQLSCAEHLKDESKQCTYEKLLQSFIYIFQALSISGNESTYFSAQLWQALSLLPFQDRFALYEVWKEGGFVQGNVVVSSMESYALMFCRSQVKRLAKENAKQIGQKLAKFMHANPIIFMQHVLNQIENFDNLIPYIVESMKYSTDLSRDVFAACILFQLKRTEEETKIKEGDTHYVQWFSALSKFIGTFYCKYPSTEIKGLMSYLLQSVSGGNASDLLLLKDLLGIMGGCETLLEVSSSQLDGLGGGKVLRTEAMGLPSSVAMTTNKANSNSTVLSTKRSSAILREELIASGTAMPLLLFIAQIRSNVLYESSNRHLKLISHFYDTAQDLMMQFADFLIAEAKSVDAMAKLMPEFRVLLEEVGLSIPVAFQLVRPLLRHGLQNRKISAAVSKGGSDHHHHKIWHPFDKRMIEVVESQISNDVFSSFLPLKLYVYFWTLSVFDISAPVERYQVEMKKIKEKLTEFENKKSVATATSMQMNPSEFSKWCKQRDSDIKQMTQTVNALSEELIHQKKHVEQMKETMVQEKEHFMVGVNAGDKDDPVDMTVGEDATVPLSEVLLQSLVLRRILMSPLDAVYCIRFCKLLYDIDVPKFCILDFYHRFIHSILPLLFASTETEAKCIGHALSEILLVLNRWYGNQQLFEVETSGKTVLFAEVLEGSGEGSGRPALSFKKFQDLYKKWHSSILDILVAGLNGKEFMYIRSSLVLLSKVSLQYPFIKSEGLKLLQRVKKLEEEEEEREDLQLMAKSVFIVITRQSATWFDDIGPVSTIVTKKSSSSSSSSQLKEKLKAQLDKSNNKEDRNQRRERSSSKHGSSRKHEASSNREHENDNKQQPSSSASSSQPPKRGNETSSSARSYSNKPTTGSSSNDHQDGIGNKRKASEQESAPPSKLPRPSSGSTSTSNNNNPKSGDTTSRNPTSANMSRNDGGGKGGAGAGGNYSNQDKDHRNNNNNNDRRNNSGGNSGQGGGTTSSGRSLLGNPISTPPNLSTPHSNNNSSSSSNSNNNNNSNSNYQSRGNYHSNNSSNNYGSYNQSSGGGGGGGGSSYHNQGHYDNNSRYQDSMRHDSYDSNSNYRQRNDDYMQGGGRRGSFNDQSNSGSSNNNNNNKRQRK